ncbi:hypothetical protein GCM10025862_04070 [Arsenicicoccus piscis]|uniref:Uncharacterized protein n=1 Tax=Arsenicicoccus piscis TaxID=673954 RepID=A0ABQ6HIM3_9MICO|nr:hypothetical protein GCM10025862_04070 [Arsenicicoccus piscis]
MAAFLVQAGVVHGRQKLADLGQGFGPYREHPLVGRGRGREEVEVDTIVLRTRAGLAERVEGSSARRCLPQAPAEKAGTLELQRVGNCGHVFEGASRPLDSLSDTP